MVQKRIGLGREWWVVTAEIIIADVSGWNEIPLKGRWARAETSEATQS